eukprot:6183883-Pyramimonas_sp.AAC.1
MLGYLGQSRGCHEVSLGLSEAILSDAWLSWAILKTIVAYLGLSWSRIGPRRAGRGVFGERLGGQVV